MPTLLLVRHGETDWNRSGQIMGDRPIPLNANGRRQAAELAVLLRDRPLTALYSSPVARAVQTAEILSASRALPTVLEPGLREIEVGDWVGRFWRELDGDPIRVQWYSQPGWARFPRGETLAEVQLRAAAAVSHALATYPEGTLVFVSHGDVLRAIVSSLLQLPLPMMGGFRFDHASLTALTVTGQQCWAHCINHTRSLPFE